MEDESPLAPEVVQRQVAPGEPTWAASLTLFLLAPVVAELLSSSTPLLMFVSPVMFVYLTALYGGAALLIRELVRRRGLGWRSVILLGAAYGVVEEGLVITSWFNPYWVDVAPLGGYSRWLGMNWLWALHLIGFHAVFSIAVPIILTELLFPRIAGRAWLSRRGRGFVTVWFTIACVLGFAVFGFLVSRKQGYLHPPPAYLIAIACTVGLATLGLRRTRPSANSSTTANSGTTAEPGTTAKPAVLVPKKVPARWQLRLTGLGLTMVAFLLVWTSRQWLPVAALAVLGMAALFAAAWWLIERWSHRSGWTDVQRLALATGGVWFLLLFGPLIEFGAAPANGDPVAGQTLVSGCAVVALMLLARRVRLREPSGGPSGQRG